VSICNMKVEEFEGGMGLLMWPNVMTHVWMWPGPVCNHVGCCRVLAHRSIFRVWAMIALILYVWVCGCVDVYDIDPWFPVFFITGARPTVVGLDFDGKK